MSKPEGPGVMRASMVLVWHAGQGGRRMIMMLRLGSGGSVQNSQSPVDAVMGGDATNMLFRVSKFLVNTAHFKK